jgi:hypothetical protein
MRVFRPGRATGPGDRATPSFAVPVLLLPAIGFLSARAGPAGRWPRGCLVAGLCVQILGNAFYWDHFLRIALDVRTKWLGQPNRSASLTADKGGFCEGCFEDVYPTVWLGPLQPILGHFWLLRHVPFEDSWQQAAAGRALAAAHPARHRYSRHLRTRARGSLVLRHPPASGAWDGSCSFSSRAGPRAPASCSCAAPRRPGS